MTSSLRIEQATEPICPDLLTYLILSKARRYLERLNYALEEAVTAWYADQDDQVTGASQPEAAAPYTGPRTLDGRPAPQFASGSSSSASKKPAKKKGVATLSSLGGGGGHDHDDDDDEDDEDYDDSKGPRDLFAGGEKSGLAVQDPAQGPSNAQKFIKDILAKAKA